MHQWNAEHTMLATHRGLDFTTASLVTATLLSCLDAVTLAQSRQTAPELAKKAGFALLQYLFLLLHQLQHVLQKARLAASAGKESTAG